MATFTAGSGASSAAGSRSGSPGGAAGAATVVVYSQDAVLRGQVRTAVGRRPAADAPRIDWVECDRFEDVINQIDGDGADLLILDGEAQPTGGMGLSRQLKMERESPPIIVLLARAQDGWLASWSQTDAVIAQPIDPMVARQVVAGQLRGVARAAAAIPHVR